MPDLMSKADASEGEVNDLKDLLAKQWVAVQETLKINQSISKLLSTSKLGLGDLSTCQVLSEHASQVPQIQLPPESVAPRTRDKLEILPPPHWGSVPKTSLTEPLLCGNDGEAGTPSSIVSSETFRKRRTSLFPNADKMKLQVQEHLTKAKYNVEDLYKADGMCQAIARDETFKNITMAVIFSNTIWIAIDQDYNTANILSDAPMMFQVMDNFYCIFFTFELLMRFFAFKKKIDATRNGWFLFDAVLVALMVWETWITPALFRMMGGNEGAGGILRHSSVLRVFRLFRLFRAARVVRVLRNAPELMILVRAMVMSARSVLATFFLMTLIVYFFAIIFTQLLSDQYPCFATVPKSINCLLQWGVFADQADFFTDMLNIDLLYYFIFFSYMLVGSMTVLNMLIGVICEVVSEAADMEKDEEETDELRNNIAQVVNSVDSDQNNKVTKQELAQICDSSEALAALKEMEVDVVALVDYAEIAFLDAQEMSLDSFTSMVMQFRGSNNVTVKDLVDVRKFFQNEFFNFDMKLESLKNYITPTASMSAPAIVKDAFELDEVAVCQSLSLASRSPIREGSVPIFAMQDAVTTQSNASLFETVLGKGGRSQIFPDAHQIKMQMQQTITKPKYNVEDLYYDDGVWQAIAKNDAWKNVTFVVIFVNTVWIGIDTDYNTAALSSDAALVFQVMEHFFCTFFTFEIMARFLAFKNKNDSRRDGWFAFDAILVTLMVWETWITPLVFLMIGGHSVSGSMPHAAALRIFRLFRLFRVFRAARVLHHMPELMILVRAMGMAVRSVGATLCLMLIIIYFYAIIMAELLSDQYAEMNTVPKAINCLLLWGAFADQEQIFMDLLKLGYLYYFLFMAYMVLGTWTVLNMLIGVVCEVVSAAAEVEREEDKTEELRNHILNVVNFVDEDGDKKVSADEFVRICENPEAVEALHELDVDVIALVDYADVVFQDRRELSMKDFTDLLVQFRGINTGKVKDLVDVRKYLKLEFMRLEEKMLSMIARPRASKSPSKQEL